MIWKKFTGYQYGMFRNAVITGACGGLGQALARRLLMQGAQVALVGLHTPTLQALAALAPDRCRVYTPDVSDAAAMQAPGQRGALVGVASVAGWRGMPGNGAYCASKAGLIAYLQSLRAELRPTPLTVHTISPGYLRTALTAGNTFAMPGLLEPDAAAHALLKGVAQGREHIVLPRRIGWLSKALSLLPARWHDRILLGQPRKPRAGQTGATPIPGLNSPPNIP